MSNKILMRCHMIGRIMTKPRSKTEQWSDTALSAMNDIARERIFGVRKSLQDMKYIRKGLQCEQASIDLYNRVFMSDLQKCDAKDRRENGIISGEPDLLCIAEDRGVDIKTAWSMLTFPMTEKDAGKKIYEWQARGYMCLYNVSRWDVAYALVDTPEELLKYEKESEKDAHVIPVSVPYCERLTIATFERDKEIEEEMLKRCAMANKYVETLIKNYSLEREKYGA